MVRNSSKWLPRFRQKKSGKVDDIAGRNLQDDESSCVPPSSVADSLDEVSTNPICSEESTDGTREVVNSVPAPVPDNEELPKSDLSRVDSKKMCLELLRRYSRLAMEEQHFSEDMSTQRSSYGSLLTDEESSASGQISSSDLPTISTQPTISSIPTITSSECSIELEQDETTFTATLDSHSHSQCTKESPFSLMLGPLLCGLSTDPITDASDESSYSDRMTPIYSKVRFVTSCGQRGLNITNTGPNLNIKNISIDHDQIFHSFSISEVSDVTGIETSFSNDEEDLITVFTCRSGDDRGVTLYSAISEDQDEDIYKHTSRYDI